MMTAVAAQTAPPSRDEILSSLIASGPYELEVDRSAGYPVRLYKNAATSLRQVLLSTEKFGPRPFLIYDHETLTYAEHFQRVCALARHLADAGVKKGDRVALGMRNYPEWSISFWACQALGAVVVALNAWWTSGELAFALIDSEPCAILIDGERLERLEAVLGRLTLKTFLVARRGVAGPGGEDFETVVSGPADGLPDADLVSTDLATILYTSGTTGNPKGAMATQRNHITNLMNSKLNTAINRVAAGLPAETALDEPQVGLLQTFPFFHIGGLTGLLVGTAAGMRLALMFKWSPIEAVDLIETHQLASASGVPIVVRQLLEAAASAGRKMESLVGITSGGAPVPPDLIRRIGQQFSQRAAPGNGYGLTETTSAVILNTGADYLAHPDSVGRPAVTADIQITGDNGAEQPQGEIGELWVRGPNVIPGYWRNVEATEAAFGGGWFRTGDLGRVDENGLYYVVDRIKDVIIRGGENVYCAEVEAIVLEQPKVMDAAVIGLPHPEYGEEVAVIIQVAPADNTGSVQQAILAGLHHRIAKFKIPTKIHLTTEELPRTGTGKILKRDLRNKYFSL